MGVLCAQLPGSGGSLEILEVQMGIWDVARLELQSCMTKVLGLIPSPAKICKLLVDLNKTRLAVHTCKPSN